MRRFSIWILILFCSCERDEIPISLPPIDSSERITQLELGDDYRFRMYYDLENDSVVAVHRKRDWDLGFEADENGQRIQLNSSKFMKAYRLGQLDFDSVESSGSALARQDHVTTFLDSTAIGNWQSGDVFIIDRGFDAEGVAYPLTKMQLQSVNESQYVMRYAELSSEDSEVIEIQKDELVNLVLFSFDGGIISEPPKESWDLLFTQYARFFDSYLGQDSLFYLVTGALSNPNSVRVANSLSQAIASPENASEAALLEYSANEEAVGWDWKEFDLNTGLYTILPNEYVVRSRNGLYYRLEFTGFYAPNGDKGAPLFSSRYLP